MENFKYSTQTISKKDIVNVSKVLKSEFLTQGPKTIEFENKIKLLVKSKYALVVNSGSSALLLACKALSLKSGDLFWTTPNSFVATANCGVLCGLKIGFVDIDPDTWNISIEKLENKLKIAKKKRKLPKLNSDNLYPNLQKRLAYRNLENPMKLYRNNPCRKLSNLWLVKN